MKELDLLLTRWLDRHGPGSSPALLAAYERLLEREDDELWAWMLGRGEPGDSALRALVEQIRTGA